MQWKISYHSSQVVKALKCWPVKMRAKFLRIIGLIEEHGPQIGGPFTKPMGKKLFEIRVKANEGIGRAFFCYQVKNEVIILHAFIKKTEKTPKHELDIALKRLKEVKP